MVKDQQWRRDPKSYSFVQEMQLRYSDVDIQRHVNNVAVQGLHAEACMRFQLQILGKKAWQSGAHILHPAHVETDFLQITHYQGPVQCGVRVVEVGEYECMLASALFQYGACVGIQEQRVSLWRAGRHLPLPDAVRLPLLSHKAGQNDLGAPPFTSRSAIAPGIDAYPCASSLTPLFGDLDADGCTGTLALVGYMEQARLLVLFPALEHAGIDMDRGPLGMLVVRTGVDILDRRAVDGEIRLAAGTTRLGTSSVALRATVFDQQGCKAVSESVMVFISRGDGRPIPMPQKLRDYLVGHTHVRV